MSAYLLGLGFRADMGTCIRKLVLLKLIDACEDDGTRIFPAIATIARAAQCSPRQAQREVRAMLDIGLLSLVREGGKGRRSTNEYAMDLAMLGRIAAEGWEAVAKVAGVAKGDTVSPLDEAAKGDTGDTDRVTPEAPKGDTRSHTTPPDSSLEPSIEREARASEREGQETGEDRRQTERAFERAFRDWPTSISDSRPAALKAWADLTADERLAAHGAIDRYVAASRAEGRKLVCSFGVYLAEKRWERLPPEPQTAKPETVEAPPFGPVWMAARVKQLLGGPKAMPPGLTAVEAMLVDAGKADPERLQREKLARFGWPAVNMMDERAASRKGVSCASSLDALVSLMEPVPVGSERFEEWRLEFARRGWPFPPDPGGQRVVYFPRGGPGGLAMFEAAVNGGNEAAGDDGGEREAAE